MANRLKTTGVLGLLKTKAINAFNILSPLPEPQQVSQVKGRCKSRLLDRYKIVNGVKYQLHATKGWRKAR